MPDETEDPIISILREQQTLRSRLDQLDAKIAKLSDPSLSVTSPTPDNLDPPSPHQFHDPITSLSAAKRKSRQSDAPPPLPATKSHPAPAPDAPEPVTAPKPQTTTTAADLEMQVGMVWLVRVGVVMLLSALVFGSKLAYTAFIADLPAIGKAALWYLFSAVLVVAGTLLERKEILKNYARVLTAGGLAAVYYTTYAIHHVERLRVVESPLIAGILLFLCGLAILSFALYKNSRNIAIAAVALAYYAGAISPLGGFAMFSNLLLTALGVTFLIRQRWAAISFVCLGGTYATFFFWQFLYPELGRTLTTLTFAPTLTYLTGYWLLFTAGTVIASPDGFAEKRRLTFSSINTAAYFFLGTLTVLHFENHTAFEFWHFALALGIAQTALSLLPAFRPSFRDRLTPLISDVLLASGLSFLTIAAFAKLDGHQLTLTLAVESALLLFVHLRRSATISRAPVLLVASQIAAALGAIVTAVHHADHNTPIPLAAASAAFLIPFAQAHFIRRHLDPSKLFTAPTTIYIGAALAIGVAGLRPHFANDLQPALLILTATALTFASSWRPLRLPELAPLSAAYSVVTAIWFVTWQIAHNTTFSTTITLTCLASAFAILLWWHFSPPKQLDRATLTPINGVAALAFCAMLATSIHLRLDHFASWQIAGGTIAVVLVAFALAIRNWPLAFVASLFHILAIAAFLNDGIPESSSTLASLVPTILLSAGSALQFLATSKRFFAAHTMRGLDHDATVDTRSASRYLANVAVAIAALTFLLWAVRFFPDYATVVITLGGLVAFAAGLASKVRTARLAALAILAFALGRILIIDVWGFATFVRFVTFFVIGAVLVGLGFIYNRYQETLRKYL